MSMLNHFAYYYFSRDLKDVFCLITVAVEVMTITLHLWNNVAPLVNKNYIKKLVFASSCTLDIKFDYFIEQNFIEIVLKIYFKNLKELWMICNFNK